MECDDNFLIMTLLSDDPESAREHVLGFLENYTHSLSLTTGHLITFDLISGYDQDHSNH